MAFVNLGGLEKTDKSYSIMCRWSKSTFKGSTT